MQKENYFGIMRYHLESKETELPLNIRIEVYGEDIKIHFILPKDYLATGMGWETRMDMRGMITLCDGEDKPILDAIRVWIYNNHYILKGLINEYLSIDNFLNLMYIHKVKITEEQRLVQKRLIETLSEAELKDA